MRINKGDSIGIIGPSGSGKTTLLDILLGLIEIDNGSMLYNDSEFSKYLNDWKSHVAYIPQSVFLIDADIISNIALGISYNSVDFAKLEKALDLAKLRSLVNQMPDGIRTMLGEGGVQLSGGQRQRIALARAFYHNRDVIVMDEATSSLDIETEKEIVDEIKSLKVNKTLVVIAHRLSTVKHCDYIFRIENGMIVSQGSYNEVVGNK
jgi:ABC-type bacteriocin/lantibiotic exporter with double-glycine peptidase domain